MAKTLIAPEIVDFSARKRWTRRECERIEKYGVLPELYELIDGEIISKVGAKPPHSGTISLFDRWLSTIFGADFIRDQRPLPIRGELGKTNVPSPDLAITVEPFTAYFTRDPMPDEIVLIVEVADTTLRMDTKTKAELYALAGIKEYWVANVAKREILRHRKPKRTGYAEIITLGPDETIAPEYRPDAAIHVGDLFPPPAAE